MPFAFAAAGLPPPPFCVAAPVKAGGSPAAPRCRFVPVTFLARLLACALIKPTALPLQREDKRGTAGELVVWWLSMGWRAAVAAAGAAAADASGVSFCV
eukprot:1159262-Pelagomonas_calceolata.AAC.2